MRRRTLLGCLLAAPLVARADTYPSKPIRVILTGPVGGLIDVSGRAIGDAIPLLKLAGKVEVVSVASNSLPPDELPGFNITRHLARHDINAVVRKLPDGDDIGSILLSYAADSAADLIVMGGYGHSRWREFVLGGATRSLMEAMTVPVFMAH